MAFVVGALVVSTVGFGVASGRAPAASATGPQTCTGGTGTVTITEDDPGDFRASASGSYPSGSYCHDAHGTSGPISFFFDPVSNACVFTDTGPQQAQGTTDAGRDRLANGSGKVVVPLDGGPAVASGSGTLTADSADANYTVVGSATVLGLSMTVCNTVPTGTFTVTNGTATLTPPA